jgi:hypothetical protein
MGVKKTLMGIGAAMVVALPIAIPRPAGAAPPAASAAPAAGSAAPVAGAPGKKAAPPAASAAPAAGAPAAGAPAAGAPAAGAPVAGASPSTPGVTPGAAPGAAPPAAPVAGGATGPAAPAMDGPTYAVRLRDLEQRIDELKEQIRRSHTRLSLLSDTILSGGGAGARATIKFQNELSSAFRVTRVLVVLDGAVQYNKTDQSGALADQAEIPIFNGSVPPGDHTLQVLVNLQGNGYGVFSYLRGYRFEVRSSHSFTAVEGKTVNIDAVSYEKGGVTTPLEERPAVRYGEKIVAGLTDTSSPAPATPGAPGAQPAGGPAPAPVQK